MKFGPLRLDDAAGALLAHSMTVGGHRFRKAHRLTADDIALLNSHGVREIIAAVLSADDFDENAAAETIAAAMRFSGIEARKAATGRVNLHAVSPGIFTVDGSLVDRLNAVDPAITLATVADFKSVAEGEMVATVKIIPFGVARDLVDRAATQVRGSEIFAVRQYRALRLGLVQTRVPGLKDSILDKTARVLESRLARSSSTVAKELRSPHDMAALARAIGQLSAANDMVIVFGASALCDFDDVIPAAIRLAGGEVVRAGMPVDPGNLLVLGRLGGKPVIGAPGCARSPKENGFDWVMDRLIAGLDVSALDIAGMGVGGLLSEIPSRPQPRATTPPQEAGEVHALVLAAGRSSRMQGPNKLLARFGGVPLVRLTVERALASQVAGVVVVTGHDAARVRQALEGLDVAFAHNEDFASGLSSSLKAGIAALPSDTSGALVLLGDMPAVHSGDMDRIVAAFEGERGRSVVRATHDGKRGNPVLLPRALFGAVAQLEGDTGARHLVESGAMPVTDVEIGPAAAVDVDTRDALERAGGVLQD